ncbi:RNA polymerase sigma factor [Parasphingorhabdus cellanae]|uniref:Sigma-70 family RNA polymerase sigma factor n=1 Tax=Parasphingorhabdus cellanae TaxID=2806553 RepID=A0ABX7TAK2_9SPHN|nr:sigma-70 family RNA polymerase sigma factor [Parasphingorhabdus cellanae]QTD57477.1 sigma-70 family RNA polymerase sigma factor [Parasphingorhabdus cellanae]
MAMNKRGDSDIACVLLAKRAVIKGFLSSRLGNAADAEDVLQDLWLKIDRLEIGPVDDPLSYLFRMAQNAAYDRRRSAERRSNREQQWVETQSSKAGTEYIDDSPDVLKQMVSRERLAEVEQVLNALPERTSYIFRAFRVEGRAQRDIAAELEISVSAVEKHLRKAYRAIIDFRKGVDSDDG